MIKYFSEKECYFLERGPNYDPSDLIYYLLDIGIIEQNSIGGVSQLCTIFNTLKEYTDCGCFSYIILRLLDKGLVVSCEDNGDLVIGSVETYLKYKEPFTLPAISNN